MWGKNVSSDTDKRLMFLSGFSCEKTNNMLFIYSVPCSEIAIYHILSYILIEIDTCLLDGYWHNYLSYQFSCNLSTWICKQFDTCIIAIEAMCTMTKIVKIDPIILHTETICDAKHWTWRSFLPKYGICATIDVGRGRRGQQNGALIPYWHLDFGLGSSPESGGGG